MAVPSADELDRMSDDELLAALRAYQDAYDRRTESKLLRVVTEQLAASGELEADEEPIKVLFDPYNYPNGWYYKERSARVYLKGDEEPFLFDFEGDEVSGLLGTLSYEAGEKTELVVNLVDGTVDHLG
ncbi:hypothetical protein [Micromonospora sp. NPDC047730]|uniref:hypothetical protein n=1 Tax=Micromonospora sp. NPDC047730 TaxID=3364253 RepID=UPI00371F4DFC